MTDQLQQCPFYSPANAVCGASPGSRIPPLPVRESYCRNEDYEDCSMFLAGLLSTVRPLRR